LAWAEAQARLQATDFFAPNSEGFLLPFLCFLHLQFQFPRGELGQIGVDAGGGKLLVLNLKLPSSVEGLMGYVRHVAALTCWSEFELQVVKFHFLPRSQIHVHWDLSNAPKKDHSSGADRLALASRYKGRRFHEELFEVLELHFLLADVANPDDERDRLAVAITSMLAGAEAQARLQATDLLAPGGEGLLLLLWLLRRF